MSKNKEKLNRTKLTLPSDLLVLVCIIASVLLFVTGLFVPVTASLKTFIFVACVILTGYDVAIDSVMKIIKEHAFNEKLLILIVAIVAFFMGKGVEGAAVLLLFRIGEVVHQKVVTRLAQTIKSVVDVRPEVVNAVINGAIVRLSPGKISVGDIISVSPGERVALDGVVISGDSQLDTAALNGATISTAVTDGCEVLSGSINLTGVINIRVTADFEHSTTTRLLRLVEGAEKRKSKTEKKIKKFARLYTPAVVVVAVIIAVLVPLIGGLPFSPWLNKALGFLVISSPGALVVSVTFTYLAGIGGASKKGILFKGADVVDSIARTTSVVFDKTGTLTNGIFQVVDVNSYGISVDRLLMLTAYAELFSTHPIAHSIVAAANIFPDYSRVSEYREFGGKGTEIEMGDNTISAGNALLMSELRITPDISQAEASVVYVAVNGQYAGRILLKDTLKPDSKKAIKDLHALGIDRLVIFTGDKKEAAIDVASQLGIKEFYAECLPADKYTRLKGLLEMQMTGDKLIFVGDGIDDAPLLKLADVGVTIGGLGPVEASETADMIIMHDEPSEIATAITLAQNTNKIVRQNIVLSLALKGLIFTLILFGVASMWMAVLADAVFSLLAIYNGMRAFGIDRKEIRKTQVDIE